ncbi:MAG TPA: rod shape-determining protein RodA [Candidatus Eisenbacteria bacterium]|nr:rod shape-determining protein RodA [Candidatus Eisenbacteria bacterium]
MQIDRRLIAHFDWTLFLMTAVFVAIGALTIYSANYDIAEKHAGPLPFRQLFWFAIGTAVMITAVAFDYRHVEKLAYPFYAVMLLLLAAVLFVGHSSGGSQRWIDLGIFKLQPSEPAKLAVVLLLAKYFQNSEPARGYYLRDLWAPTLLVTPLIFLTLVQPDLGTAIILGLVFLSMVMMAGLRVRSFLWLAGAGMALLPVGWQFLRPYQQQRVWTFLDPGSDPLGAGYHVIQSQIAVGSGRLFGKGFLGGTQNRLDFLPAQHTDFIFAVFSEEWGLVGCGVLLLLYLALIGYCLRVMERARDRLGGLLVFGMLTIIFWHLVINISMVTGLLPVVGVPLPLISYGGSSLASVMFAIGIIMNVSMRRYTF